MAANHSRIDGSSPVALVTGGVSGIGLAVTRHLVQHGWKVAVLDRNAQAWEDVAHEFDEHQVSFYNSDVTNYEQQAKAFVETWNRWHKLNFVFSNAGFPDQMNLCQPVDDRADGSPPKPDITTIDVCLNAMVYSAYLALHYFRKNQTQSGKLIFTASMGGLYPAPHMPLYTAAKHGIVGLTRALAKRLETQGEQITVNCICPGLVPSGLSQQAVEITEEANITPASTVVRAVMNVVEDTELNGQVVECSAHNVYYREQHKYADTAAEFIMTYPYEKVLLERQLVAD